MLKDSVYARVCPQNFIQKLGNFTPQRLKGIMHHKDSYYNIHM